MISPQTPPQPNKSRYRPIGLTLVAGVLLAWGSCYGFLQTRDDRTPLAKLAEFGFFAGVFMALLGLLWTFLWVIKRIFYETRGQT